MLRKIKPEKKIGQKTFKDSEMMTMCSSKANQLDLFVYWAKRVFPSLDPVSSSLKQGS